MATVGRKSCRNLHYGKWIFKTLCPAHEKVIRQVLNADDVHHFPLVQKVEVSELQTETRSTYYVFLAYRLHIHTQISDLITSRMYETFSTLLAVFIKSGIEWNLQVKSAHSPCFMVC